MNTLLIRSKNSESRERRVWAIKSTFTCRPIIPYERQRNTAKDRRCGAASLAMLYRSFGIDANQESIYEELGRSQRTYRLARHAREKGLVSLVVRFHDPWTALLLFRRHYPDGGAVLNHRIRPDSGRGHFSVLLDLDTTPGQAAFLLHDPQFGPNRRIPKEEMLQLWTPTSADSEIRGRIAVLIRPVTSSVGRPSSPCSRCNNVISLASFSSILESCAMCFCPCCDNIL